MQIVIEIPDGCYEELTSGAFPVQDAYRLVAWVKNGIPLPKGHGAFVDLDVICDKHLLADYVEMTEEDVKALPVVIEADKGVEE